MVRLMGLAAVIPATMFLTINYFVMFANRKTDDPALKKFGNIVSILLWISAALALLAGLYVLITGHHPAEPFLRQMLQGTVQG